METNSVDKNNEEQGAQSTVFNLFSFDRDLGLGKQNCFFGTMSHGLSQQNNR